MTHAALLATLLSFAIAQTEKPKNAKKPPSKDAVPQPPSASTITASGPIKASDPTGLWLTKINLGFFQSLRLVADIKKAPDGKYRVTLDSPDQNANDLPAEIEVAGDHIKITAKQLGLTIEGDRAGDDYAATFEQGALKQKIKLTKIDAKPHVVRPQDPKPPFPYRDEEVAFANPQTAGKVTLGGTFSIPPGAGPHPAVVMITGSGAQNRNEEIMNHRPFWVIADRLARNGIAVLRLDDRGVGKSTGATANDTSADFATDIATAVDFLRLHKSIDAKRIGLVGHSEGGLIAPMVAAAHPDKIAFAVLLAGTGISGDKLLMAQGALIAKASGANAEVVSANRGVQEKLFKIVIDQSDRKKAETELRALFAAEMPKLPAALKAALAGPQAIDVQIKMINSPWMRFFFMHEPAESLKKTKCPVLLLFGEKDLQVPPSENAAPMAAALAAGGNKDVELVVFPKLNHLFQTSSTGSPAEYAQISETFAPIALDKMTTWLRAKAKLSDAPTTK